VRSVRRSRAVTAGKRERTKRLVRRTTATAQPAGDVPLRIKLTKRAVRKILKRRKFNLPLAITYTPTGGDPNTERFTIKIRL